jgi:hypothetical protein
MIQADPWNAVTGLWQTTMHALVAWLLIAPVIVALVYVVLAPLLRRLKLERVTAGSIRATGLAES